MAVGPYDWEGELAADPEEDWARELPELDEAWNEFWWHATMTREELRFAYRKTPMRDTPRAAA